MPADSAELRDAVDANDGERIRLLLQEGADVNSVRGRHTACTRAIELGHLDAADLIISSPQFDVNFTNQFERTPLHFAAKNGHLELVKYLINIGARVDQRDVLGITPLGATAWHDSDSVAEFLLQNGADVNTTSSNGETPLYRACKSGNTKVAKTFIRHGCDANVATNLSHNHPGHTPLMASLSGVNYVVYSRLSGNGVSDMVDLITRLISENCNLDATDFRGRTALCIAVTDNNICAAILLAESGCDLNKPDLNGTSPLQWALQLTQQRQELAKILILYGADVDFRVDTCDVRKEDVFSMIQAIERKPLALTAIRDETIRLAVSAVNPLFLQTTKNELIPVKESTNLSPMNSFEEEDTLLDAAVLESTLTLQSLCKYKIRKCLGNNVTKKLTVLPLPQQVKLYLNLGYDYIRRNPKEVNSMYIAVGEDRLNDVERIVRAGTDVEATLWNKLPLTLAAEFGTPEVVRLLLSLGSDPSLLDGSGDTALHIAARNAHTSALRCLLKTCASVDLWNVSGRTPLHDAAFNGDNETFETLLEAGAELNLCDKDGITALHYMAGNGNEAMVRRLLDAGVDSDVQDSLGNSPLHVAASKGRLFTVAFLRLPVLYRNEEQKNHTGVIKALVDNGCNLIGQNAIGQNAMDIAKMFASWNTQEVVELLTSLTIA